MIGTSAFIAAAIQIAFGVLFPVALAFWWLRTRREKLTTVLLGAATWFVFAILLESVPKLLLLNPATGLGRSVLSNTAAATVIAALLAGLFEETGRFVVFRTLLRRRVNRETSISFGIGHGCFEAMYLLAAGGGQNIAYAVMINSGRFGELVGQTAAAGMDTAALEALPAQLAALTPAAVFPALVERVFAVLMHVGLSVLVFSGAKRSKPLLYVLAIVLHALFDVPAALYQFGVIRSVWAVEALLAVYALALFAAVYFALYRKDAPPETGAGEAA
jgi:uncharacterized membrane protein YhfC